MKKCRECANICEDDQARFCPFCGQPYAPKREKSAEPKKNDLLNLDLLNTDPKEDISSLGSLNFASEELPEDETDTEDLFDGEEYLSTEDEEIAPVQTVRRPSETMQVLKKAAAKTAQKTRENALVQAVKNDVQNSMASHSAARADDTARFMKKKKLIAWIAIVLVVGIVVTLIAVNTHRCEECDKIFIGEERIIWGETVCKSCYKDFYSFKW